MSEIGKYEVESMVHNHHVYRVHMLHGENYKWCPPHQAHIAEEDTTCSPHQAHIAVANLFHRLISSCDAGTTVDSELFGLCRTESVH